MGLQVVCDCGCGKVTENMEGMVSHGFMHKVYYLPECSEKMVNFAAERDKIHTDVAKSFHTKLDKLKAKFLKENPGAKLPDHS